jgi:ATP-dependent DNA helicase RecG
MVGLGMIDTLGYGISDMHNRQAHRFLPMPDYDLSPPTWPTWLTTGSECGG